VDEFILARMVEHLIAVGSASPILGTHDDFDFAIERLDDLHAVVGGPVIEHVNAVVTLLQHLRQQLAEMVAHVVIRDRCNYG
jgi:hypothetical protein